MGHGRDRLGEAADLLDVSVDMKRRWADAGQVWASVKAAEVAVYAA